MMWQSLSPSAQAAYGSLLGALTGDACGAPLEFLGHLPSHAEVEHAMQMPGGGVFDVAPGQFTDDGEMTVALLESLAAHEAAFDVDAAANAYIAWANSKPFDIGNATSNALLDLALDEGASRARSLAESLNCSSKANGSLMRATPLGVVGALVSVDKATAIAKQDAALTHPNKACVDATVAYTLAIRHLIRSPGDRKGALRASESHLEQNNEEVYEWLADAVIGDLPEGSPMIGFVRIAFTHAFHHLAHGSTYAQALRATLRIGGDTDTNACIVGGLLGAASGVGKIPALMLARLLDCDVRRGQARPKRYTIASALDHLQHITRRMHEV